MLCRPLFEDMVVAHWLVLHEDDPRWLLDRFFDHRDAIAYKDARTAAHHWDEPLDVSVFAGREDQLAKFGEHAQKSWWACTTGGKSLPLHEVVTRLADSPRFRPRFSGEQPGLQQWFDHANRYWNWTLHHTAVGMPVQPMPTGRPVIPPPPDAFRVLSCSYWAFAQLVYLVLDVCDEDWREFEQIFLSGLMDVFARGLDAPAPRRA